MKIKKKRPTKKDRVALEARFIGRVIYEANYGDVRGAVAGYGINWRCFSDRRHQAIWRSLETLDLKSTDERMDAIEKEAYAGEATGNRINDAPGDDLVRGEKGSAADKAFKKKLIEESGSGILWLERGLEEAGALRQAGGKAYLRQLAETGEAEVLSPETLISDLFGK